MPRGSILSGAPQEREIYVRLGSMTIDLAAGDSEPPGCLMADEF